MVCAFRLLGKYVLPKGTGTLHYGLLGRLSPCVTCMGRCTGQGDSHGLGDRAIQLNISLLFAGHLVVQALEKIPVQRSQCCRAHGTGGLFWHEGFSSMTRDAEGGDSNASGLSSSMCPSSPNLAALLSLVSIPVTPTSALAGQWGKEENGTGPNRAKRSRQDPHRGSGYGTRVASRISLQHLDHHFGGTHTEMVQMWHQYRTSVAQVRPMALIPFCNAMTPELLCCFMSTIC